MRTLRLVTLAALVVPLWAAPLPAGADVVYGSTVSASGSQLTFTARPGYRNVVDVRRDSTGWWVSELGGLSISAAAGCTHVSGYPTTTVRCPTAVTSARIDLGDWDDTLTVRSALNSRIFGGTGNDRITGGPGQDHIDGGTGADTMNGGVGNDTVTYESRTRAVRASNDGVLSDDGETGEWDTIATDVENLWGGSGWDSLYGNGQRNLLYGLDGWDSLYGLGGNDHVDGGDGNDRLDGGTGADTLFGGNDTDTVDYGARTATVNVWLDGIANDGESGEGDSVSANTENVTGGRGHDVLVGNDVRNVLTGGPGDDVLLGRGGDDALLGEDGADALLGEAGNDWLPGDRPGGPHGRDHLDGGDGIDSTAYEGRSDPVYVTIDGSANDGGTGEGDNVLATVETVYGGNGDDWLIGSADDETLVGGNGHDFLAGGAGKDVLRGGYGDDMVEAGDGNDYLYGDGGVDWLNGQLGFDSCEPADGGTRSGCESWL